MSTYERFWRKVLIGEGCWEWTCSRTKDGHGLTRIVGERVASRAAWVLEHGPIPYGMCVLHKCDNPPCVRPSHLFLGTHKDNSQDRQRKGRAADKRGELHGRSKITEADVVAIRAAGLAGMTTVEIAKGYPISPSAVSSIRCGRSWGHVPW